MRKEGIIFDMDGTLYSFDKGQVNTHSASSFGKAIMTKVTLFFQNEFSLTETEALKMFQEMNERHKGEVSLGLEKEFGIPRSRYFGITWDLDPSEFLEKDDVLIQTLSELEVQIGVLTAAPNIWTERVLEFMQLDRIFGSSVFTGEPDLRKPNPLAFMQLCEYWALDPNNIISIGDQEHSDILPAKSVGMTTVRIGSEVVTEADFLSADVHEALNELVALGEI